MNRPREDGKLFFLIDYFYQCWPDGPLGTYADFDFHRLSFHLQNECLCKKFPLKIT